MNIKLRNTYSWSWSIGSNAKAKYVTVKKQNKEDMYFALREIVDVINNRYNTIASFYTYIECIDNPELSGNYDISFYFNRNGDTFFEMDWYGDQSKYLENVRSKNVDEYDDIIQGLFEAIVDTKEFKKFARKATKNIQECFEDVIEPLYKRMILGVSDELTVDEREAINNLMKLKGRIVSSATLNLSHPELENM